MLSARTRLILGLIACSPMVSYPGSAAAVNDNADSNTLVAGTGSDTELAEVVVSAQRRSENVQNVPISVAAFSASQLADAGITSTSDLPLLTPGLVFGEQVGTAQPFLRGIGTVAAGPGVENPIALYVDNVYYSSPSGAVFSFNNIDQIEVDKGPQGTLFGRNATGGLIQVKTKDPSQTFGGSVSGTFGDYATSGSDIYVTGGITNQLAADLAVHFLDQSGGFGRNLVTGQRVDKNEDMDFRNKWLLRLDDGTRVELILDYSVSHFIPAYGPAPGTVAIGAPSYPIPPHDIAGVFQPFGDNHQGGASLQIAHDFDFAKFVSITAYRRLTLFSQGSAQLTDDPTLSISSAANVKNAQITQELQLLSLDDSRISWTAGSYFYIDDAGFTPPLVTTGGLLAPFSYIDIYDHQKSYSAALYGQATTQVARDTNLTVGLRYTLERRNFDGNEQLGAPGADPIVIADSQHKIFQKPTWRLSLDHHFSPDMMMFASYNRGFKSGGFNDGLFPTTSFSPESLDAYEIGAKSQLLDHHLTIDTSAFLYNYKNIQAFQYFENGSAYIYNAASARLYGLDFDARYRLTSRLTVTAGFEAIHSAYQSFPNAAISAPMPGGGTSYTMGSAEGNKLPLTPGLTTSLSVDYTVPTVHYGSFRVGTTYAYNSGFFGEPDNRLHQPSYNLVNAQAEWESASGGYSVRLWGKNLTNADYTTAIGSQPNGDFVVYAPPRTYGITISKSF